MRISCLLLLPLLSAAGLAQSSAAPKTTAPQQAISLRAAPDLAAMGVTVLGKFPMPASPCLSMRSYLFKRDDAAPGAPRLKGQSICSSASDFRVLNVGSTKK